MLPTHSPIRRSILLLLLSICWLENVAQTADHALVPVTTRFAVSKKAKHHNYRLQVLPSNDSMAILGFGFTRMTKSLKSLRLESAGRVKRATMQAFATISLDSVYEFNRKIDVKLNYVPAKAEFEKQKMHFLSGKHAPVYFSSQWVKFAKVPIDANASLSFETKGVFKSHHRYVTDFLPAAVAWQFPAIDPWNCEPAIMEFMKLRKLQGYGTDKIKYTPYQLTSRMIVRQSFEVYFPHNEIRYDTKAMERIIQYLEQNAYVILKAELEGGCSLEGTVERNTYLQKQRAAILQKALHKYSDELIKKDTVLLTDEMLQFREMIRTNYQQFKKLDTLTDENLRQTINTNEKLKAALEPIFVLQRKASLKLVLAKRLTRQEQFSKFLSDLNKAVSIWHTPKTETSEGEHKVMGMLDKLFSDFENKYMTEKEVDDLISETTYPDYVRVLFGYHLLKKFEDKTWPSKKSWKQFYTENNVGHWLSAGQQSLLNLLANTGSKDKRSKYLRMLTDYQVYNYHFIEMGLIDFNSLCTIPYPESPEFMGLILNQYAYLYELAAQSETPILCMPESSLRTQPKNDSVVNVDGFIEEILRKNETRTYRLVGNKLIKQKDFDQSPKGAYYYLLKQHYVKNNKSVLDNVTTESGGANVQLNVFNLWHLVSINVERWDPVENHFYDEEIQLEEMSKLIGAMHGLDKHLCRPQVNNLYLSFHLKMLYYLERYAEAGNIKHAKYADASLKFVSNYYKSRARNVTPRLSMHVIKQLNLFNWLPGVQHGASYGYDLLTAISKERILSEEEMKMYAHYLKLYNPEMKKMSTITLDKERLVALMAETY